MVRELAAIRQWILGIYRHYHEFHSYGPPRLMYMGWVGVFGIVAFYFMRFTRPNPDLIGDLPMRLVAGLMFLSIGLQKYWPAYLKRYFIPFSYATLLFGLLFFNVYNGLDRGGGVPAISNAFIVMCFLTLLVDWRNLIVMLVIGVTLSVVAHIFLNPGEPIPRDLLMQLPAFLFIALAGYLFSYSTEQVVKEKQILAQQQDNERRLAALGDTLGFMAHELNTPLATARGCVNVLRTRYNSVAPEQGGQRIVQLTQRSSGEIMDVLDRTERAAHYCQTLISRFVQSAKEATPGAVAPAVTAADLIGSLLTEYPFEDRERPITSSRVDQDFILNGRRDLLYLVFCTITKNALQAMYGRPNPRLSIEAFMSPGDGAAQARRGIVRFRDNGPGVPAEVLEKLSAEPFTTKADDGGAGMGLVFCRRVMESAGGALHVESRLGTGITVTLEFDLDRAPV